MNRTGKYTFGRTTVSGAGGGTRLPNVELDEGAEALIRAIPGNAGNVYIATTIENAAAAANRITLRSGESLEGLRPVNLNVFCVNVDTANDGIEYIVEGT